MAKNDNIGKAFGNENPLPSQKKTKKPKDVKTPNVKIRKTDTSSVTSSETTVDALTKKYKVVLKKGKHKGEERERKINYNNGKKVIKGDIKAVNKAITKGVKSAKKSAKKVNKAINKKLKKVDSEKKKKYLKEMNDWAREQLKATGYDAKTSAKLRKGFREHFKDRRISSMSTKTRHKEIMQYIQAKAQAATGITYQELNNLLKNKVIHNYKSDNYRQVYYKITEYAGETAYTDINRYKNEYVTAEELERIINTFKDKGPAKDTKGLRKAIRIQVDMFIKNKSTVSGMVGAYTPDEWGKLRETSEPDFVTKMTKEKRKKKRR